MKEREPILEDRTVAILIGLCIGVGLVVDKIFLLAAVGVALFAGADWFARAMAEYLAITRRPRHR